MTTASGADISLDGYEFDLDESIDPGSGVGSLYRPHYDHALHENMAPKQNIHGEPNKSDLHNPNRILWGMDDWSGGEGNRYWDEQDPTVYRYSPGLNGRLRFQLTGRPARRTASFTVDSDGFPPFLRVGDGQLWIAGSQTVNYTDDGSTFTRLDPTDLGLNATDAAITAAVTFNDKLYISAYDEMADDRYLLQIDHSNSDAVDGVVTPTGADFPFSGLAIMGGRLYGWTGAVLQELDIFNSFPLGADQKRNVSGNALPEMPSGNKFGSTWWADCVAAESSVFCFASVIGQSFVYEFRDAGGFSQVWQVPEGFTVKDMIYQNGVLYFSGHYDPSGRGGLWAMPLATRRPTFVGWFRKSENEYLHMQEMCNSWGSQLLITAKRTGRVFVYDADLDALSMLDDFDNNVVTEDAVSFTDNDDWIGDVATFGKHRYATIYSPGESGTSCTLVEWDTDEPPERQASTSSSAYETFLEIGSFDLDLPFEQKVLHGFEVVFDKLTAGQKFTIKYQLDGGSWTTADAEVDFSNAASQKGRIYLPVSTGSGTTSKFSVMAIRIYVKAVRVSGTDYQPPIIRAVYADAQVLSYEETFELIVRLKNEQGNQRPSRRKVRAAKIWNALWTSARKGEVLTFLDGYGNGSYVERGIYQTYNVTIADMEHLVNRNGEGVARLTLRVSPQ